METVNSMIIVVIEIALLLASGFILGKCKIITSTGRKAITDIIMAFILPAGIVKSFIGSLDVEKLKSFFAVFVVSFLISLFSMLVARFLWRTKDDGTNAVLRYGTLCPNVSFMGSPIVKVLFGDLGLMYWAIFMIPYRIFMYTYGVGCFTRPSKKDLVKKFFLNPCVVATMIGIVIMVTQISVPPFLVVTLNYGGVGLTGLSMLVIGSILAEADWRTAFSKLSISFTAVRLIILPALICVLCWLCNVPPLVAGVCTVLHGTPAGTMGTLFAEKYNGNTHLAAQTTFISTVISIFTMPGVVVLLTALYGPIAL